MKYYTKGLMCEILENPLLYNLPIPHHEFIYSEFDTSIFVSSGEIFISCYFTGSDTNMDLQEVQNSIKEKVGDSHHNLFKIWVSTGVSFKNEAFNKIDNFCFINCSFKTYDIKHLTYSNWNELNWIANRWWQFVKAEFLS